MELYKLLLEELKHEHKVRKQFDKLIEEINRIFDIRKQEVKRPILKFSIFDPLRNAAAKELRMRKVSIVPE